MTREQKAIIIYRLERAEEALTEAKIMIEHGHGNAADGWQFIIKLEDIVDDYYFGFPTLLDGAETAPPEDVGGLPGFYEFLNVYRNENHPEHKEIVSWAKEQRFREYDPEWINVCLKNHKYRRGLERLEKVIFRGSSDTNNAVPDTNNAVPDTNLSTYLTQLSSSLQMIEILKSPLKYLVAHKGIITKKQRYILLRFVS